MSQPSIQGSIQRSNDALCAALVAVEVLGMAVMWTAVPFAWIQVGGHVGAATSSLAAASGTAFFGFLASVVLIARGLRLVDNRWVELRTRAGYKQREGALTQVAIISTAFGLLAFFVWYYILSKAYILPFMPTQ